jgi:hypothetical protein
MINWVSYRLTQQTDTGILLNIFKIPVKLTVNIHTVIQSRIVVNVRSDNPAVFAAVKVIVPVVYP